MNECEAFINNDKKKTIPNMLSWIVDKKNHKKVMFKKITRSLVGAARKNTQRISYNIEYGQTKTNERTINEREKNSNFFSLFLFVSSDSKFWIQRVTCLERSFFPHFILVLLLKGRSVASFHSQSFSFSACLPLRHNEYVLYREHSLYECCRAKSHPTTAKRENERKSVPENTETSNQKPTKKTYIESSQQQ